MDRVCIDAMQYLPNTLKLHSYQITPDSEVWLARWGPASLDAGVRGCRLKGLEIMMLRVGTALREAVLKSSGITQAANLLFKHE